MPERAKKYQRLEKVGRMLHSFHIPVMGTGFTVDTPIRVAHFGISSVISLADDLLLEKIREFYSRKFHLPFEHIPPKDMDVRAKRITAYLDMVRRIVRMKMEKIKKEPFFESNDKRTYFEMLPLSSPLRTAYDRLMGMAPGKEREDLAADLTARMVPGAIDVNVMVKVDRTHYGPNGEALDDIYSDAKAALRGFANSRLVSSSMVFSAGINKGMFRYMTRFRDFYRDALGGIKKKITLKVSDFRSAQLQGKFLAQMGLEVSEYRIESGLNCGGHAFGSSGRLLSSILTEMKEKRDTLSNGFRKTVAAYYKKKGWEYVAPEKGARPLVTVQGGIGTHGEARRLTEMFGADATGWGTPFLLVPEAVCLDRSLLELLRNAGAEDLYLSGISPLGVPFNLVRNTTSEKWNQQQFTDGHPGSICPKKCLVSNTEFTEKPICTASRAYQSEKIKQIMSGDGSPDEKRQSVEALIEKTCLCEHLGNSALIRLGIASPADSPTVVCPGPNLAWFNRFYSLKEMVDHMYGKGASLVSSERPHMFAQEYILSVDRFEQLAAAFDGSPTEMKRLEEYKNNLDKESDNCRQIAAAIPYPGENLESIMPCVDAQQERLMHIWHIVLNKKKIRHIDELKADTSSSEKRELPDSHDTLPSRTRQSEESAACA
jgi:hypothetical protein